MRIWIALLLTCAFAFSQAQESATPAVPTTSQADTKTGVTPPATPPTPPADASTSTVTLQATPAKPDDTVSTAPDKAPATAATQEPPAILLTQLQKLLGPQSLQQLKIIPAPIPGLYEVMIEGYIFYVSSDGHYLIRGGEILDLNNNAQNLTEDRLNDFRAAQLASIDKKGLIEFAAKDPKYVITVFTDVDCPYCNKIHQEVSKLNQAGVTVRYAAFPRAGKGSPTYDKMVSVWCAKDRKQALTDAKSGKEVPAATCSNPIDAQYEMGHKIGVSGTPAIIMSNGHLLPGYMPATRLIQALEDELDTDNIDD